MACYDAPTMKHALFLVPLLLLCACGATMNLGVPSPTISRPDLSPTQIYRAAKLSLAELGLVEQASAELGLVEGRIPPFQVKAVMERGAPTITLLGMGSDKGEWRRDTQRHGWVLTQDGKEHRRKGAPDLAQAVERWHQAIQSRLK